MPAPRFTFAQPSPLRRVALKGFEAVCEALYPPNDFGAPSYLEAEMVARANALWDAYPPTTRLMMEGLFAGLELGGSALLPALGPLSRRSPEEREALFQRLGQSKIWPVRFAAAAIKSTTVMLYLSHPKALAYLQAPGGCLDPTGGQGS